MYPVLFAIGPFELRAFSVLVAVGFFVAAFVFWRKGREEYYQEDELFDAFLLSTLVGFLSARVGYVLMHAHEFSWNILRWLDVFTYPGMSGVAGIAAAGAYLLRYAKDKKWDQYEVLDFWVLAIAGGSIFVYLGAFFDGFGIGYATQLPWGVRFPGVFQTHHPVQLYSFIFSIGLFWYLSWVEYRYRTFQWYRATKKAAQTGFLVCVFLIASSLFSILVSFLRPASLEILDVNADRVLAMITLIAGVLLLYTRSGRSLGVKKKKRKLFS